MPDNRRENQDTNADIQNEKNEGEIVLDKEGREREGKLQGESRPEMEIEFEGEQE